MILDQYGKQVQWQAAAGAVRHSNARPWEPVQLSDIGTLVPSADRKTLLSASRRLFLNMGVLRGACEQKAMYAVGRAWSPKFEGTDTAWGSTAIDWLANQWYGICDIRGGMHDFKTALYLLSVAIDRDGEAFVLLTENENGYPRIQHIPCHRIGAEMGSNKSIVEFGPYKGLEMVDGIVYGKAGNPVAAQFLDEEGKFKEFLSFRDLIHVYDPSWQEQGRGLPGFTHAINDLRDSLMSHNWERQAQMASSSIALIEHNELGGLDPNENSAILAGNTCAGNASGIHEEVYSGGSVRYFRANSGGKLDPLFNPRPGESWESFQDRIVRSALAGINWPYGMVWKPSGQGTAERNEIGRAQRAVEDRQDLLLYAAKRMAQHAISKAMFPRSKKTGKAMDPLLPFSSDWWRIGFTMPTKLTIDDGRVSKELIDKWRAGLLNATDIVGMHGADYDAHLMARAEEVAKRKLAAIAAGEKYGVKIEEREMAMMTPNEQPPQESPDGKQDDTEAPDKEKDDDADA